VRAALTLVVVAAAALFLAGARAPRRVWAPASIDAVPASTAAAEASPWGAAARRVTEDRGEPTGRQAKVEVPEQLRHYSDSRRFLAIQVAEWKEHGVETPHDYAGLAGMIRAGELVELPTATESYVLYGVGALADTEPFTHFDKSAGRSVTILDEAELAAEYARLDESAAGIRAEIDSLKRESDALGRKERSRLASLRKQIAQQEKALKAASERRELLDAFYREGERRRDLDAERDALAALAGDFSGRSYDLAEGRARKVRMLGHLRPEALAVLRELADSYRQKFGRPLPVTSLVRPDEYQHRLSKSNSNATRIDVPPHSTGLAFDILYRHMTAEEQEHVMADIARLRDAGRVESLRENRDHFHVFAFVDGQRPGEELIRESLGHSASKARREPEPPAKKEVKEEKRASKKEAAKKGREASRKKEPAKKSKSDKSAKRKRR
jgi:Family of unknown function (DUF5715)